MSTTPLAQPPAQPEEPKKRSRVLLYTILGILIVLLLVVFGFRACQSLAPQPTPPPVTNGDTSWTTVKDSGVWMVGTSSGYPPFEFYTENHNLDGFDIALAYEIGKKLGVQVNIQDFAFDGLSGALQMGQIDSAIAAISVTPERASAVNFSNVYYVGVDGILAQKGSPITSVKTPQDMANKRVGVERGTVYETWVQNNLVNTGLISANQMFVYAQAKDAVNDLSLGRLDLVMGDLQPAIASTQFFAVVLVGQGLSPQRMAIAVMLNGNALTAKINQALVELQNQGVIAQLEKTYLNLDPADAQPVPTPLPTPTVAPAAPTPTWRPSPTAPTGCVDSMQFIRDLTYDTLNGTEYPDLNPGQSFKKGWQIRNTGTCTWDSKYYVNFVSGTQMNGQPTAIQGSVAPGTTYDLYVNLVAPTTPGRYDGNWQMFNPSNLGFGQRLWVAIEVIGPTPVPPTKVPPTATPPVQATPTSPAQPTATVSSPAHGNRRSAANRHDGCPAHRHAGAPAHCHHQPGSRTGGTHLGGGIHQRQPGCLRCQADIPLRCYRQIDRECRVQHIYCQLHHQWVFHDNLRNNHRDDDVRRSRDDRRATLPLHPWNGQRLPDRQRRH